MAGAVHHVYARGNDRQRIFADDADRRAYLCLLGQEVARRHWRCLTYCLMANHVHLLVETPAPNLSVGMCLLQGQYARRFNRRHGRTGHVFQGRYGAVRIEDDAQLWMTVGYIARNPVEAGLVARAGDWRWSSHQAVMGRAPSGWLDVPGLFGRLGALGGDPLSRYAECVAGEPATAG